MSISLTNLVVRLQGAITERNGIPSDYAQIMRDSITFFNARVTRSKVFTLSMVANTATYALPSDFIKIIQVASLNNPSGVILSQQGIIPVNALTWKERFTIAGNTISFYPVPQYALARDIIYAAGFVLDNSQIYADMTEQEAVVILEKAQELALLMQSNEAAKEAWNYSIGDESVNKTQLVQQLREQAKVHHNAFELATAATNAAHGTRATYTQSEQAMFGE